MILCEFLPEARTLVCLTRSFACAQVYDSRAVVDYVTSGSTSQASAALGQVRGLHVGIGMGGRGCRSLVCVHVCVMAVGRGMCGW